MSWTKKKKHAYLTIYAYDENGDFTCSKNVILTEDGKIVVEEGGSIRPEKIPKKEN